MADRYRVTHVPHFIGGRLVHPDQGEASIVTLPDGVEPGRWLELVSGSATKAREDGDVVAAFEAKHIAGGRWAVVQISDGSRASRLFTKDADGDAKAAAEAEAKRLNDGGQIDLGSVPAPAEGDGDGGNLPDA